MTYLEASFTASVQRVNTVTRWCGPHDAPYKGWIENFYANPDSDTNALKRNLNVIIFSLSNKLMLLIKLEWHCSDCIETPLMTGRYTSYAVAAVTM